MDDYRITTTPPKRSIWLRGLLMLLLALVFHLCGTILFFVAVIQFVLSLVNGKPQARLQKVGLGLGRYLLQLVGFLTFATEELPFPFSDWPSAG